jgi:hypothetical protein
LVAGTIAELDGKRANIPVPQNTTKKKRKRLLFLKRAIWVQVRFGRGCPDCAPRKLHRRKYDATPLKTVTYRSGFTHLPLEEAARTPCDTDLGGFNVSNREKSLFTAHLTFLALEDSMNVSRNPLCQRVNSRPVGRSVIF